MLDRDLKREVAPKLVRFRSGISSQRFLDETQVLGQLEHPHIVPLYEMGLTRAGNPYYTGAPDGQEVPPELERACLRALCKSPAGGHPTARDLHDQVQDWLESEADRSRRHERAEVLGERVREGRAKVEARRALQAEVVHLEGEIGRLSRVFKSWQPVEEKAPPATAGRAASTPASCARPRSRW